MPLDDCSDETARGDDGSENGCGMRSCGLTLGVTAAAAHNGTGRRRLHARLARIPLGAGRFTDHTETKTESQVPRTVGVP